VLAQSLQERRCLRVVAARRVALQVSSTQLVTLRHFHYCNYEPASSVPHRRGSYVSFGMRLRAKRPARSRDGRSASSRCVLVLHEHRTRGRNIYVIVNKFRIPIAVYSWRMTSTRATQRSEAGIKASCLVMSRDNE
jgi:hypothetical protein